LRWVERRTLADRPLQAASSPRSIGQPASVDQRSRSRLLTDVHDIYRGSISQTSIDAAAALSRTRQLEPESGAGSGRGIERQAATMSSGKLGGVVDDPADLMYGMGHTTMDVIDAGHDDYYGHGIAGCPDLGASAFLHPMPADPELPPDWPAAGGWRRADTSHHRAPRAGSHGLPARAGLDGRLLRLV